MFTIAACRFNLKFPRPGKAAAWTERLRYFAARNRALTALGLFAFTSIVAVIDYAVGDAIPLMILYLPAIVIACCLQNIGWGVALSLVCSCLWLIDDMVLIDQSGSLTHKYWLAVVHLAFFVVVAVMTWRLRLSQEREHELARTDALTRLANRKAFLEAIDVEIARARRSGSPLAIAYMDCDNFKTVNDTQGHAAGDGVLRAVADVARSCVRATDTLARLGGDEFACLLPDADEATAREIVERLQARLHTRMLQNNWPVTLSVGVAVFPTAPQCADEVIGIADGLMYEVKSDGKNALLIQSVEA